MREIWEVDVFTEDEVSAVSAGKTSAGARLRYQATKCPGSSLPEELAVLTVEVLAIQHGPHEKCELLCLRTEMCSSASSFVRRQLIISIDFLVTIWRVRVLQTANFGFPASKIADSLDEGLCVNGDIAVDSR